MTDFFVGNVVNAIIFVIVLKVWDAIANKNK
jgi:hypothetical protein